MHQLLMFDYDFMRHKVQQHSCGWHRTTEVAAHWALFLVFVPSKTIVHLDAMGSPSLDEDVEFLQSLILAAVPTITSWTD